MKKNENPHKFIYFFKGNEMGFGFFTFFAIILLHICCWLVFSIMVSVFDGKSCPIYVSGFLVVRSYILTFSR